MALDYNFVLPAEGHIVAGTPRKVGGILTKFPHSLIQVGDGPSADAFGRLRVSNPTTLFDSKLLHGDNAALLWDEELVSGTMATAGPTAAKPFIDFTSTNVEAGTRTRQTFQRFNYQPGKSHLILMTGVLELATATATDVRRRIGYFDDDNGVFFESNDALGTYVVVRTNDTGSPVDTAVAQASWNLDTMDGGADADNPSGITADFSKAHIFVMDLQWLSVGRVRFGLEIGGILHYVHEVNANANVSQVPYMSTANLPLRFQIIVTGTATGVCSMRCICGAVISEGGIDETGIIRCVSTAGAAVTSGVENTLYALVAVRLKTTHLGAHIMPVAVSILITSASENIEWVLIHGDKNTPITTGGGPTYVNVANSACQSYIGVTANTVSGGTVIMSGHGFSTTGGAGAGNAGSFVRSTLTLGAAIDGTRSELILAFRPIGGASAADVEGALVWQEVD